MHHVLHPRSYSWLSLAFLALASGCPASPPDVSLRSDSGPEDMPDARVADAAGPGTDAPGPQGDGGGPAPDARPGVDGGGPVGMIREYGWPPSNQFPSDVDYPPDLVILQRLTVVNAGDVAYLGLIVNGLSGTAAKIGLYRETSGLPSSLVATTDVFTTVLGVNQHPPLNAVNLPAGNYWLAVVFDGFTSLATSATTMSTLRSADVPFLSALPANLTSSTQTESADINVYVGILEP
jgi:hypothetical protein